MSFLKSVRNWLFFVFVAITFPLWCAMGYRMTLEMTHRSMYEN